LSLEAISAEVRLFVFFWAVLGSALASGALLSAHLNAVSVEHNGVRRQLARARRASEAWSFVAQFTFLLVAFSFIVTFGPVPTAQAQISPFIDGLLRIAGFGIGAMALAVKSLIALISENRIMRSL
jgi:heme/copper-type cytochrome/quinol oxidase subunit 3